MEHFSFQVIRQWHSAILLGERKKGKKDQNNYCALFEDQVEKFYRNLKSGNYKAFYSCVCRSKKSDTAMFLSISVFFIKENFMYEYMRPERYHIRNLNLVKGRH